MRYLEVRELPVGRRIDEFLRLLVDLVLLLFVHGALVEEPVHQLLDRIVIDGVRLRL